MKSLSRILAVCLYATPFITTGAVAVVAKNSGHNLTAYEPSNVYNNQWATLSNGRSDTGVSAKADFGNCNALILRCAQPKCSNGGCSDMNVAGAIVAGCVQSNKVCEQYGNDLISYMSAQLVANSTAKINAQNAAAAQAAQAAQSEQIAQMQQQMQSQLSQMQQQMAQQNAETQQQVQAALEQQAQQNAAALENITSASVAANSGAAAQPQSSGLSSYQEEAINRGVSTDVLERQKITGQIMTEIENAETSLSEVQKSMIDAFEYAGCDRRGNNCTGPKRVKKFRERALNFIDPYDNVIDKIYDALETAQMVGVDLSEVYLLLNDSCNRWGEYLCPMGTVVYDTGDKGQKTSPKVCDASSSTSGYTLCVNNCTNANASAMLYGMWATLPFVSGGLLNTPKPNLPSGVTFDPTGMAVCLSNCAKNFCQPCTLLRTLTDSDEVYKGWVNAETTSTENQTVIACASNALNDSYIGRRTRRRRGAGIVDIDHLEQWLSQVEPGAKQKDVNGNLEDADKFLEYCGVTDETELRKAKLSKALSSKEPLCVTDLGKTRSSNKASDDECSYINRNYALCDTHLYNANLSSPDNLKDSATRARVKEIVALKVNVITEQMYKQYEFLAATLRRLKTHLEKSVLTANLQSAGGSSSSGATSDSGSSRNRSNDDDKNVVLNGATNCSAILDFDQFVTCLQSNVSLITTHASNNSKEACVQLQYTLDQANSRFTVEGYGSKVQWVYCDKSKGNYLNNIGKNCQGSKKKQEIINCANEIVGNAAVVKRKINASNRGGIFIPGN